MIDLKETIKIDSKEVCEKLEKFIRQKLSDFSRKGIVFGLSGGLDSAVTGALCVRAVGKSKVLALVMPEKDTEPQSIKDAQLVAKTLGIEMHIKDITPYLAKFGIYKFLPGGFLPRFLKRKAVQKLYQVYTERSGETPFASSLTGFEGKKYADWLAKANAYYRIKHRIRMIVLYLVAELENRLVVGAANKSELMTGFFVKHGCDDASDIMPLAGLYKTQVRQLANYLAVPKEIIEKAPSPDIIPGITDEFALSISYEKLDLILLGIEKHLTRQKICEEAGVDLKMVDYVRKLIERSEHMRDSLYPKFN